MKKRLALFKSMEHGFECTGEESFDDATGYIRLSEFVDINFPALPNDDVIAKQVATINDEITRVQAETEAKLNTLRQQRDELLALPYPERGGAQ